MHDNVGNSTTIILISDSEDNTEGIEANVEGLEEITVVNRVEFAVEKNNHIAKSSEQFEADGVEMLFESHNALIDFPHSRHNCMKELFGKGEDIKYCNNCYCYVCDCLASACLAWNKHCSASHESR